MFKHKQGTSLKRITDRSGRKEESKQDTAGGDRGRCSVCGKIRARTEEGQWVMSARSEPPLWRIAR